MANTRNHAYLSDQRILAIVIGLCEKISGTKSVEDAVDMLSILLTPQEVRMIAIRLQICEMILLGHTYKEISDILCVSGTTISRTRLSMEAHNVRPVKPRKEEVSKSPSYGKQNHRGKKAFAGAYGSVFWPVELLGSILEKYMETRPPPKRK